MTCVKVKDGVLCLNDQHEEYLKNSKKKRHYHYDVLKEIARRISLLLYKKPFMITFWPT